MHTCMHACIRLMTMLGFDVSTIIYPKGLELIQEDQGTHASVLKAYINIVDEKFVYKLHDKRDSFPIFL